MSTDIKRMDSDLENEHIVDELIDESFSESDGEDLAVLRAGNPASTTGLLNAEATGR